MSWHKMSIFGKVAIFIAGFGIGFGVGVGDGWSNATEGIEEGNKIEVNVDAGKVKKGGTLDLNLKDLNQSNQENNNDSIPKKRKKFLGIF